MSSLILTSLSIQLIKGRGHRDQKIVKRKNDTKHGHHDSGTARPVGRAPATVDRGGTSPPASALHRALAVDTVRISARCQYCP